MLGSGGLLPGGELDRAHSSAPSPLRDTVILAGFVIGTGRHPGAKVRAHPSAPEPAAMKSAAVALPLSWEGVSAGSQDHHGIQSLLQPSAQPHGSSRAQPHGSSPAPSPMAPSPGLPTTLPPSSSPPSTPAQG